MSDESLVDRVKPLADAIQQDRGTLDSILNDEDLWLTITPCTLLDAARRSLAAALECLQSILIVENVLIDRYNKETDGATSQSRPPPQPSEACG